MSDDFLSDFNPNDPLLGVTLTAQELEQSIIDSMAALRDLSMSADNIGSFASTLSITLELLPVVAPMGDETIDPEEIEAKVCELAKEAEALLRELPDGKRIDPKIVRRLGALTKTPIKTAREQAEAEAIQVDKLKRINVIKEEVRAEEKQFAVTAKDRRRQAYNFEDKQKNGTWLSQKTTEITDNGSLTPVFRQEEADLISGIALGDLSQESIERINTALDNILEHDKAIRKLGGSGANRGLLSAMMSLKEMYESDEISKLRTTDLKPLMKLAERMYGQQETSDDEVIDTLYEGPFANCEVVPVSPFEGLKDGSTVIIKNELVNEENILADINIAVAKSRGNYLVLPERVKDFVKLRQELIDKYGIDSITIFRTLKAKWHPLPWYVIRVKKNSSEYQPYIALLESPIYGNASYVLNHKEFSWLKMMEYRRKELSILGGAKSFTHSSDSPTPHIQKLANHLHKGMI